MRNLLSSTFYKIKRAKRLSQLLVLVSFLITFVLVRIGTHLQKIEVLPDKILPSPHPDLSVHHLVPGIFLLLISGYIGLSFWSNHRLRLLMSVLFGVGAALTIDEFALWLYLKDVYWERQGRDSIDAIIIFAILLTIAFLIAEAHDIYVRRKKRKLAAIDEL